MDSSSKVVRDVREEQEILALENKGENMQEAEELAEINDEQLKNLPKDFRHIVHPTDPAGKPLTEKQ